MNQITRTAAKWLNRQAAHTVWLCWTKVWSMSRAGWSGMERSYHTAQTCVQFRTYGLFIYGLFRLIYSDFRWPRVTETVEREDKDKGGLLYSNVNFRCAVFQFRKMCTVVWLPLKSTYRTFPSSPRVLFFFFFFDPGSQSSLFTQCLVPGNN